MANPVKVREVVAFMEQSMMKNPRFAFGMDTWKKEVSGYQLARMRPELKFSEDLRLLEDLGSATACGTAMCFAGWAQEMQLRELDIEPWYRCDDFAGPAGAHIMELSAAESQIFYDMNIQNIADLKMACNYYFSEDIFEPEEFSGSKWHHRPTDGRDYEYRVRAAELWPSDYIRYCERMELRKKNNG